MTDFNLIIDSNESIPLRDVVHNTLRDSILSGKLVPGERLLEKHLAAQLGVSRTPVRDALRMLEHENLVELVPWKGAQVLTMSESDIKDILEVRLALEPLAAKLSCERITKAELEKLIEIQNDFQEEFRKKNYEKAAELDELFHNVILKSTKNEHLINLYNELKIQLFRYRFAYLKHSNFAKETCMQHENIVTYIKEKDLENAEISSIAHVKSQVDVILSIIKDSTLR